jgi:heme-degrading monooxygenase HmoA
MIAVVSQAWTLDEGAEADAYIRLSAEFLTFMKQQPGFLGRRLLRGQEDRTHFTNIRLFDTVASYEELTQRPGYGEHIQKMGAHLKPYTTYPREFMDVILRDDDLGSL